MPSPLRPPLKIGEAGEAQQRVETDRGESPARAEGQSGQDHGKGLQRDGDAKPAHGNGANEGGTGHQRGENRDESKVGGVPAARLAGGRWLAEWVWVMGGPVGEIQTIIGW